MVVNLSVSCFKTAILDAHGQYKSEKIKNDTALAFVKHIALVDIIKLCINSVVLLALLQIVMVETISSFAIIPTSKAQTNPALFKPIGANKNETLLLTKNNMLSFMFCV